MKKIYFIFIVILLGGWFLYITYQTPKDKMDFQIAIKPIPYTESYFSKTDIPMPEGVASAHSATLISLQNGDLLTAFFAGSREGAKDVKIYGSVYDSKKHFWNKPFVILSREDLSKKSKQYIKKLGNPVLYRDKDRIYLFVVGVSIGGWATSKIYEFYSDGFSPQKAFTYKQILKLSPFANISNLVRSVPIALSGGGFILPIYHELADQYSLMVRFDSSGNVISINKPNNLHRQLQPSLAPLSHTRCLSVFRNKGMYENTMFSQLCEDSGRKWLPPEKTNIKNYDNSANLIRFNKDIYLIHNTFNKSPHLERGTLTLSMMVSPEQFRKIIDLDYTTSAEVSYPTTITDGDNIDIVYTFDRKNIRHIRLNRSYLRTKQ